MQQLAQFLAAAAVGSCTLCKVISHFFRKEIARLEARDQDPFFVEIEVSLETDWDRRR